MAYTYSKIDWVATDTFEVTDWVRIRDNYYAIWSELQALLHESPLIAANITSFTTTLQKPYYDDVNTLETALQYMYTHETIPFVEWRPRKTWTYRTSATYPSVGNPSYDDWNRWEIFIKRMWETIQYWNNYPYQVVSGMSYSGTNRRVQVLSRGR